VSFVNATVVFSAPVVVTLAVPCVTEPVIPGDEVGGGPLEWMIVPASPVAPLGDGPALVGVGDVVAPDDPELEHAPSTITRSSPLALARLRRISHPFRGLTVPHGSPRGTLRGRRMRGGAGARSARDDTLLASRDA
jgi:hypothetical protein